jgi:hypothetical protein
VLAVRSTWKVPSSGECEAEGKERPTVKQGLFRCGAMWFCRWVPMFRIGLLHPSSREESSENLTEFLLTFCSKYRHATATETNFLNIFSPCDKLYARGGNPVTPLFKVMLVPFEADRDGIYIRVWRPCFRVCPVSIVFGEYFEPVVILPLCIWYLKKGVLHIVRWFLRSSVV